MDYSKINRYKNPVVAGSVLAGALAVGATFYGVRPFVPAVDMPLNQAVVDLKIKGNKESRIYHMKGCPNYDDIKESHIVWFKTHEEARAAGFRMAQNCR